MVAVASVADATSLDGERVLGAEKGPGAAMGMTEAEIAQEAMFGPAAGIHAALARATRDLFVPRGPAVVDLPPLARPGTDDAARAI